MNQIIQFAVTNPLYALFALIGVLGGIVLALSAILFIYLRYNNKIRETQDFGEHIMLGSFSLFLGLTLYMTDFQDGVQNWVFKMTRKSTAMPMQYLFAGLLYFKLLHHLYKQHLR